MPVPVMFTPPAVTDLSLRRSAAGALTLALALTLVHAGSAAAAIAYRASAFTAATNSSITSLSIAKPTGTTSGDVLIANIVSSGGTSTGACTPPTGWTLVKSVGATGFQQCTYYKVAGASEATSYAFTFVSSKIGGVITGYSGADATTPIEASSSRTAAAAAAAAGPTVTTTYLADRVVLAAGVSAATAITPGAGDTEHGDTATSMLPDAEIEDHSQANPGTSSAVTPSTTSGATGAWVFTAIALRPPTVQSLTAAPSISFGTLTLTGADLAPTTTAALTVSNNSPTGWNITASASQFTATGPPVRTLLASAAAVTGVTDSCAGAPCTPTNAVIAPITLGATATKIYNAATNTGMNASFTVTPTVRLKVPGNAYASSSTYSSTLTFTLANGP